MIITILNGELPSNHSSFTQNLALQVDQIPENYTVNLIDLQNMTLRTCIGCWSCWYKTPGYCPVPDDSEQILRKVIASDLVVFASPVTAGFTSSLLKTITDKFVTLVHPYIIIKDKEYHHLKRYKHYPNIAVYLQADSDTDEEDLSIIRGIYQRMALNFHATFVFAGTTKHSLIDFIENPFFEMECKELVQEM